MKKLFSTFTLVCTITSNIFCYNYTFANNGNITNITVTINQNPISLDIPPIQNGLNVYIPVRQMLEKAGYVVSWDFVNKTIVGERANKTVVIPIGKSEIIINDVTYPITAPIQIIEQNAYAPFSAIGKILDSEAVWNTENNTINFQSDVDNSVLKQTERKLSNLLMELSNTSGKLANSKEFSELSAEILEYIKGISLNSQRIDTKEKIDIAVVALQKYIEQLKLLATKYGLNVN